MGIKLNVSPGHHKVSDPRASIVLMRGRELPENGPIPASIYKLRSTEIVFLLSRNFSRVNGSISGRARAIRPVITSETGIDGDGDGNESVWEEGGLCPAVNASVCENFLLFSAESE